MLPACVFQCRLPGRGPFTPEAKVSCNALSQNKKGGAEHRLFLV